MKYLTKICLAVLSINAFSIDASDVVVVANTSADDLKAEKRQIRDIFMGNDSQFFLKPVVLTAKSEARFVFNTKIVGLTESRIQSYWAQMRFSGRKKPPQEFETIDSILAFLQENKNTVAYLPADTEIPANLTIIYKTE
jgi:hypothetical protein